MCRTSAVHDVVRLALRGVRVPLAMHALACLAAAAPW